MKIVIDLKITAEKKPKIVIEALKRALDIILSEEEYKMNVWLSVPPGLMR